MQDKKASSEQEMNKTYSELAHMEVASFREQHFLSVPLLVICNIYVPQFLPANDGKAANRIDVRDGCQHTERVAYAIT